MVNTYSYEYLMHHGVKGMHWGIRRYQNADGSLTEKGYKHYKVNPDGSFKSERKQRKYIRDSEKIAKREKTKKRRYLIGGLIATGLAFAVANRALFKTPVKDVVEETAKKGSDFIKGSDFVKKQAGNTVIDSKPINYSKLFEKYAGKTINFSKLWADHAAGKNIY